jgi:molybdopterin converting factor small subunit
VKISVEYTAQLRAVAGIPVESIDVAASATVEAAIQALAQKRGERFSSMLLNNGKLKPHILIWVKDEQVQPAQPLSPGSHILLLSPISGG